MKVMPYNSAIKASNFGTNTGVSSNPKKKMLKIDTNDAIGWGLCCGMGAFEGVRCAKPNFKNLNIRGKIGRTIGGVLIALLIGTGLFAVLKFFEKLGNKEH